MGTLFLVISILGVLMALGTVLARNLVHAALFLVGFFFLVACQFVLLEAEFMAAMQVLVYIGAVAILLLFGIMLTRNIQGDETTGGSRLGLAVAGIIGLGLLAVLVVGIREEPGKKGRPSWTATTTRPAVAKLDAATTDPRSRAVNNMGLAVGNELMTRFAVPFEVAGLLLTAALVGAVALAQGEGADETPRRGGLATVPAGTTAGPGGNGHAGNGAGQVKGDILSTPPGAGR
jgi:NADH-quinone oxidoreductase subunit J